LLEELTEDMGVLRLDAKLKNQALECLLGRPGGVVAGLGENPCSRARDAICRSFSA